MKKFLLTIVVLTAGVVLSANSYAATTSTTLDVSLNVVVSCTVQTNPVVFSGYDGSQDVGAVGDVEVTCPDGLQYVIALDSGQLFDGQYRQMTDNIRDVNYLLFDDGGIEWGDAGGYGDTGINAGPVAGTGVGSPINHGILGQVPSGQTPPPGQATDVVNVTVYY